MLPRANAVQSRVYTVSPNFHRYMAKNKVVVVSAAVCSGAKPTIIESREFRSCIGSEIDSRTAENSCKEHSPDMIEVPTICDDAGSITRDSDLNCRPKCRANNTIGVACLARVLSRCD